ncbi:diguanylate cyclase (GGDEF) domain-containing protein [Duganella sacchari]|uniref:diguanylate cyclase n=1 Tax=Duganella sacchari TaxID=551987 RepID=A0A1M7RC79_9BURK|nr:GGDEF domain-containing protein [Duganella sacchari]SHN43742.1 diguanylate cyclase (GGDEF) domain-containing protein [Duganella sacchari]
MTNKPVKVRQLSPVQLRILLTLSRELLQTDDVSSSLGLVGRVLVEVMSPDSALLLLQDERLDVVCFDRRGVAHPAGQDHMLYPTAAALLSGTRHAAADMRDQASPVHIGPGTLAVAVPAHAAVAVLAVSWTNDLASTAPEKCGPLLTYILELAAAALGKIAARSSLEQLLWQQREQIASSSMAHAAELERREQAVTDLRVLALTDVLTGLYNRRGFFMQAEQIFKVAQRKRADSAVIFADIDGLKHVNDELGHDTGDALIRDAASVFRQSFREADVVSRLGGDEFVAYTLDDARPEIILQRIRDNLHAFNLMQERPYAVAISAGIVRCEPGGKQALSDYVLQADEQMYAEKRSRLH